MTFDTKTLISIANKMIKSGTEFRKWKMCMINYLLCRSRYFLIIKCGVWNRFSIDSFSFSFSHNFGRLKCYYVLSLECVKNKNIIRKSTVIVGFSVFGYCKQNVWNKEVFAIGFDHLLYFISCVYLTLSLSLFLCCRFVSLTGGCFERASKICHSRNGFTRYFNELCWHLVFLQWELMPPLLANRINRFVDLIHLRSSVSDFCRYSYGMWIGNWRSGPNLW